MPSNVQRNVQRNVHVIGAGISGLSAAVRLANAGYKVHVHEATQQAGGRCRSYFDAATNLTIDNGNHLLLSGNRHALAYARSIGTEAGLVGPASDGSSIWATAGCRYGYSTRPAACRIHRFRTISHFRR
jgi:protoporphyrinogen oxidase